MNRRICISNVAALAFLAGPAPAEDTVKIGLHSPKTGDRLMHR